MKPVGHAVIGTVKGGLHDIGKNPVSIMLEGTGFEIHDRGLTYLLKNSYARRGKYNPI